MQQKIASAAHALFLTFFAEFFVTDYKIIVCFHKIFSRKQNFTKKYKVFKNDLSFSGLVEVVMEVVFVEVVVTMLVLLVVACGDDGGDGIVGCGGIGGIGGSGGVAST